MLACHLPPFRGFKPALEVLENREVPAVFLGAAGAGSPPQVRVFDGPGGNVVREFTAFDPGFTGGVYVG